MEQGQGQLLQLVQAKQNSELQEIKKRLTNFSKYFFNSRRNITIVYDSSIVYVIHKEYLKLIDLGKAYVITDLAYNFEKNVLMFLTIEGNIFVHFQVIKSTIHIKKDYKKVLVIDWIYNSSQTAHIFVAEEGGVHFYRFEEEKKIFKEVKHLSGKYHCFLHEPTSQLLIGFTYGDCQSVNLFQFEPSKAKNWFRAGEINVNLEYDEVLIERIRKTKSFGLESSRTNKQVFCKKANNEDYFIDCLRIANIPYICFYIASEGKLKLIPTAQLTERRTVAIKLPSDSIPNLNIVDNMLVVHLKNERITFIYDVTAIGFQTLVSPYPLLHTDRSISAKIYQGEFVGKRVLLPEGLLCKWKINLNVIYHFLKNQILVFQFLNRRSNSKMEIIRWLRQNLFSIKPINISKIWKLIFAKNDSGQYDESEMVTIVQIYSNLFYTLSLEPLISKEALTIILLECLRQSHQFRIKLPGQLQYLTVELLLHTKRYEILTYLCHHCILNAEPKIYRLIFDEGERLGQELLLTLSIDLASQASEPKEMLSLLLRMGRYREGKRFLKANFEKFEVLQMLEMSKHIKSGDMRREFVKFVRQFITLKFPTMNTLYLDEAEKKLLV